MPDSKNFSVRLFEKGDEEQIIELLQMAFSEWSVRKSPLDYWKWKYINAPFGYEVVVAESDHKIIGAVTSVLIKFKIGKTYLLSNYGDDGTTHPDYRGMGVFSQINLLREQYRNERGIKLAYGFSVVPTVIKDYEKRGRLRFPHQIVKMLKLNDVDLHIKHKKIEDAFAYKSGYNALKIFNRMKRITIEKYKNKGDYKIITIKKFDEDINMFWKNIKDSYNFIIEKKKEFLNWRYCDPRAGEYTVKVAIKDSDVLGYIVTEQKVLEDYREGYVVDLLALPERNDVSEALMGDICADFDKQDINALHYKVVQNNLNQEIANRFGFIDISSISKEYYSWQYRGAEKEYVLIKASNPNQVHFNMGDYV